MHICKHENQIHQIQYVVILSLGRATKKFGHIQKIIGEDRRIYIILSALVLLLTCPVTSFQMYKTIYGIKSQNVYQTIFIQLYCRLEYLQRSCRLETMKLKLYKILRPQATQPSKSPFSFLWAKPKHMHHQGWVRIEDGFAGQSAGTHGPNQFFIQKFDPYNSQINIFKPDLNIEPDDFSDHRVI